MNGPWIHIMLAYLVIDEKPRSPRKHLILIWNGKEKVPPKEITWLGLGQGRPHQRRRGISFHVNYFNMKKCSNHATIILPPEVFPAVRLLLWYWSENSKSPFNFLPKYQAFKGVRTTLCATLELCCPANSATAYEYDRDLSFQKI